MHNIVETITGGDETLNVNFAQSQCQRQLQFSTLHPWADAMFTHWWLTAETQLLDGNRNTPFLRSNKLLTNTEVSNQRHK
jgi:hypothetical protein